MVAIRQEWHVGKRLEVTVFGTMHLVGALHLTQSMVKAGMELYGSDKWGMLVRDIALGRAPTQRIAEIGHTLGHTVKIAYRGGGIALQGARFGLEVFQGGEPQLFDAVAAENAVLDPESLLQGYTSSDLLGVFWGQREGALSFRWDDADPFDQGQISLVYDDFSPLLAGNEPLELVHDITWQGIEGRSKDFAKGEPFTQVKHAFHKIK